MFHTERSDILFHTQDVFSFKKMLKHNAAEAADDVAESRLRTEPLDNLADEIAKRFNVTVPALIESEISVAPPKEVEVPVGYNDSFLYGFEGARTARGTAIVFDVPFTGDPKLFQIQPSSFTLNPPRGEVQGSSLVFTYAGISLNDSAVKAEFERFLSQVKDYLGRQEKDLSGLNADIKRAA